ncbi:hypothetical protein BGZ73_007659 [Actinomortierella ambigua]|nr:hypothetical protein BGZ73_007659 [Actinomortierella ambigua]
MANKLGLPLSDVSQLVRINDGSFFAIASGQSPELFLVTRGPDQKSFTNTRVDFLTNLVNPQFGYSTKENHLVVIGDDQSGRLGVQFFAFTTGQLVSGNRAVNEQSAPETRTGYCFTWDVQTASFYLFGGQSENLLNDVYSFKYENKSKNWIWTRLGTPSSITPRANAACAVQDGQLILWGGTDDIRDVLAETIILPSPDNPVPGGRDGVSPPFVEGDSSSPAPLGAIIGGSVGGLVLVMIIFGLIMFCRRKRRRNAGHHRRSKGMHDEHEVYETKSRSMPSHGGGPMGASDNTSNGGAVVVPLVPSPFETDHDDRGMMDPYSRSPNTRSGTESSSFTAGSTLHSTSAYMPHHQPLIDHAMVPAISSPQYMTHSATPSPPLPPIMTNQPFGYNPHTYTASTSSPSPLQGSPTHRLSLSAPLPLPAEVEIQSRAISLTDRSSTGNGSVAMVTPQQPFDAHGSPSTYMMNHAPPLVPPPSSRPFYSGPVAPIASPTAAPFLDSAPVIAVQSPPPPPPSSSQEPEWDELIPVTDEDDMSTQAALGMTSSVGGLSASHREFKHELPDSDHEGEEDMGPTAAAGAAGRRANGTPKSNGSKPGSTAAATFGRRSSVSSVASHPESESGIGFLELWVPPADEPPVPPVPQLHQ